MIRQLDGHQNWWIARFTEQFNTCDVLFRGGGKIKLYVFSPAKKPQMPAGRWWHGDVSCGCLLGFPVGEKLITPWNAMHSVTIILKTRRTKAELHIKGINKYTYSLHSKWTFYSVYQTMWGPKMIRFWLQKFWLQGQTSGSVVGGWKNCHDNDVGNDSIVDGLLAITITMRIRACFIRRQIRILFDHGVPAMQGENSLDPENPKAPAMNENSNY